MHELELVHLHQINLKCTFGPRLPGPSYMAGVFFFQVDGVIPVKPCTMSTKAALLQFGTTRLSDFYVQSNGSMMLHAWRMTLISHDPWRFTVKLETFVSRINDTRSIHGVPFTEDASKLEMYPEDVIHGVSRRCIQVGSQLGFPSSQDASKLLDSTVTTVAAMGTPAPCLLSRATEKHLLDG